MLMIRRRVLHKASLLNSRLHSNIYGMTTDFAQVHRDVAISHYNSIPTELVATPEQPDSSQKGYSMQVANLRRSHSQRGISLLESLVSIVVMSMGILGILGVQMRTLADTQTGVRRAQAIRLIEDLSERMKVNPNALGNTPNYISGWGAVAAAPTDCKVSACQANELALYDIAQWKQSVTRTLPLADAIVFRSADEPTAATQRQIGVMISWRESERRDGTTTENDVYKGVFTPDSTAAAPAAAAPAVCPADRICHLQYIQLSARCARDFAGGAANVLTFCPL